MCALALQTLCGLTATELPKRKGGGRSTEAQEERYENFTRHVKQPLPNFIMVVCDPERGSQSW